MTNTTDVEDLDVLRDEKRNDAAQAGAVHPTHWTAGQHDPDAVAEIARLKGVIGRALAAMQTIHPDPATQTITPAEIAGTWNATLEILRAG